ncbi:hypothetical protein WAF17_02500 [Bernardetia sp. ABR2-2B]|uniref:hypothetical protein n=1 Tax=Bernardetia sp. ABR2-2B TaxID=3127472 RepID=UPI0030D0162A
MPTYNFEQFDAEFEAKDDKEAQQIMNAFHKILKKFKGNNEGLLKVSDHIIKESRQFKMLKKLALK